MTDREQVDAMAKTLVQANNGSWGSLMETSPIGLDDALGTKPFWRRLARAALAFRESGSTKAIG